MERPLSRLLRVANWYGTMAAMVHRYFIPNFIPKGYQSYQNDFQNVPIFCDRPADRDGALAERAPES